MNNYLIEIKEQQSVRLLPTYASLQSKLAGKGSDTMQYGKISLNLCRKVRKQE